MEDERGKEREEPEVTATAVRALSAKEREEFASDIAEQVLNELPLEAKVKFASEAGEQLPPEEREKLVRTLQALSPQERKEIGGVLLPEQTTTNRIWIIIVSSFSFVLVLSVAALCVAVLWQAAGEIQILLTVVTTIAGLLAGFISGRASTSGSTS